MENIGINETAWNILKILENEGVKKLKFLVLTNRVMSLMVIHLIINIYLVERDLLRRIFEKLNSEIINERRLMYLKDALENYFKEDVKIYI